MISAFRSKIPADLIGCFILVSIALCFGIVFNQFRDLPIPLVYQGKAERLEKAVENLSVPEPSTRVRQAEPTFEALPEVLTLDQFKAEVEANRVLILDARPEIFHRLGHVPGALAMPRDDFEKYYRENQDLFERDKSQQLIIYCSGGDCEDSGLIETALRNLGYNQISIFEGGWNEWTRAGLTEETN